MEKIERDVKLNKKKQRKIKKKASTMVVCVAIFEYKWTNFVFIAYNTDVCGIKYKGGFVAKDIILKFIGAFLQERKNIFAVFSFQKKYHIIFFDFSFEISLFLYDLVATLLKSKFSLKNTKQYQQQIVYKRKYITLKFNQQTVPA